MKRPERVDCQSCGGTGRVTYPEAPMLGGGSSPEAAGWCLACNGWGHYVRDGKMLTHAGPMKEDEC